MQEVEHGVNVPDSAVEIAEVMRRREMQARFFFAVLVLTTQESFFHPTALRASKAE
jgi:hypothetical protein